MAVVHNSHNSESMTGEERSMDYLEDKINIELDIVMTSEQRNVDTLVLAVSIIIANYILICFTVFKFCWVLK